MSFRYRALVALTLAVAACIPADARLPRHGHSRLRTAARATPIAADDLYSRRALRRTRTILELKLLELKAEHLERVRKALERHIPIDQLLQQ
jgi:hypothetical protein